MFGCTGSASTTPGTDAPDRHNPGFRVRYVLATKLVNELVEATDEKILAKTSPATAASTCSALTTGVSVSTTPETGSGPLSKRR